MTITQENLERKIPNSEQRWYKHYGYAWTRAKRKNREFNMRPLDFKYLWYRDKADQLKRPSIDRKNNAIGYLRSNCRFIELSENSRNGNRKHSDAQVIRMRKDYEELGFTLRQISEKYNVNKNTLFLILKRKTFSHI